MYRENIFIAFFGRIAMTIVFGMFAWWLMGFVMSGNIKALVTGFLTGFVLVLLFTTNND